MYVPRQKLITSEEAMNKSQIELSNTVKVRVQADPNLDIRFAFDALEDENGSGGIRVNRAGLYEFDLRGVGMIQFIKFISMPENATVLIDYLSEDNSKGV